MNEDKTNKGFKMDRFKDIVNSEVDPNQDIIDKLGKTEVKDGTPGKEFVHEDDIPRIPNKQKETPLGVKGDILDSVSSSNQMGSRTLITKEVLDIANPADILTPPLNAVPPLFEVVTKGHIARICYEAMREYSKCINEEPELPWDSTPAWRKKVIMTEVEAHFKNPLSPMGSHNSWMREKFDDGWKYGEVKDVVNKIHPCLVPYSDLPPKQQAKDFLFGSIVVGLQLFTKEG